MKKYDLLKVLGITLFLVVLLSWCIPTGTYSEGSFTSLGQTSPIGLIDIIKLPFMTIMEPFFWGFAMFILVVGGFYGVLNKTEAYSKIIDKITKFDKNKTLVITIIIFVLLSAISGDAKFIIILLPFFVAILSNLGYDKLTTFASTIGSLLVGQICSVFSFNIWGLLKEVYGFSMLDLLIVRLIFLIIITTLYVLVIRKHAKINNKKKNETLEAPLYKQVNSKKKSLPLIVISVLAILFIFIGTYNWSMVFDSTLFDDLYQSINGFKLGGYALFHNLLGSISVIGSFTNYDVIVILVVAILLIGWVYSIKLSDIFTSFLEGVKVMIKPALYSVLACIIITSVAVLYSKKGISGNFVMTMVNTFMSTTSDFKIHNAIGSSMVMSFAYNDFYNFILGASPIIDSFDLGVRPAIAFVLQTMHGLVMLVAPTSAVLFAGLSYMDIKYKEWIKYIWKYALIILGIVFVIASIITSL